MAHARGSNLITVTCSEHHQTLVEGLWNLFRTKNGVDFDFGCGGRTIAAHRLVVDVLIPQAKAQPFKPEMQVSDHLDALLEFLYRGTVTVPESKLDGLLGTARGLDFQMLVDAVESASGSGAVSDHVAGSDSASQVGAGAGRRCRRKPPGRRDRGRRCRMPEETAKELPVLCVDAADVGVVGSRRCLRPQTTKQTTTNHPEAASSGDDSPSDGPDVVTSDSRESMPVEWDDDDDDEDDGETDASPAKRGSVATRSSGRHSRRKPAKTVADAGGVYRCAHCNGDGEERFVTSDRRTFRVHQRSVHKIDARGEPIAKHACSECERRFESRTELKLHRMRVHTNEKPYKCSKCEFATILRTTMDRHIAVMHENIRAFMCSTCGHKCATRSQLANHEARHSVAKPHVCSECSRAYSTHDNLSRHRRVHAGDDKSYVCHECGHAFHRQDHLKKHLRSGAHASSSMSGSRTSTHRAAQSASASTRTVVPQQSASAAERPALLPHYFGGTNFSSSDCSKVPQPRNPKLDSSVAQSDPYFSTKTTSTKSSS